MRSILLSAILLSSLMACGTSESNDQTQTTPETPMVVTASGEELPVGPCCSGGCETPVGYCCNEGHCGGNCDESLPVWDHQTNAPKLN